MVVRQLESLGTLALYEEDSDIQIFTKYVILCVFNIPLKVRSTLFYVSVHLFGSTVTALKLYNHNGCYERYQPAPQREVLLAKPTASQFVRKFPFFYGNRRSITVFLVPHWGPCPSG
jgi:hypothetical protein